LGASNLHDSGTVVGNSLAAILINHQKVTAVGTQSGLDGSLNSETGIDVGDDLSLSLGGIGSCKKFDCQCLSQSYALLLRVVYIGGPLDFEG